MMERRQFMKKVSVTAMGFTLIDNNQNITKASERVITARDYLKDILYTRKEIDAWFSGEAFPFSK